MDLFAAALVLLTCQDPPPPPSPGTSVPAIPKTAESQPVGQDVITLLGGEKIIGTILKQQGNYIEVRLGEDNVVGFDRSRVQSVRKAAPDQTPGSGHQKLSPQEGWYLLHDGEGNSAGYLHSLVQTLEDGSNRISEEWCFSTGRGSTQITILESSDRDLLPKTSFYHERVINAADRLVSERLLQAEVSGSKLVVRKRSLQGRSSHEYPVVGEMKFPLTYREELRQASGTNVVQAKQQLFDSRRGEFRIWGASCTGLRKVQWEGKPANVRELALDEGAGPNTEWIDGELRVVRREVNGAALVAVRVTEARARRAAAIPGPTGRAPAVAATGGGNLAVWLPNPTWRLEHTDQQSVLIKAPLYQAEATLMELDQVPDNVQLASAADLLVRWLRLTVGSKLKVRQRDGTQVKRAPAIRLELEWSVDRQGESTQWRGVCHLFRVRGKFAALMCSSPAQNRVILERDFERIVDSVQIAAQDIEPEFQGPLAPRAR